MASKSMAYSFLLDLAGVTTDLIFVVFYNNIILYTDFIHWVMDSLLELTLLVGIYLASRVSRRYPLGVVFVESTLGLILALSILGVYFYNLYSYLNGVLNGSKGPGVNAYTSIATGVGIAITLTSYFNLRSSYGRQGVELLRYESTHALMDSVASVAATVGILVSSITGSAALEILFTLILTVFIIHSVQGILQDSFRIITGETLDYKASLLIMNNIQDLVSRSGGAIKGVEARRLSSFYVVNIDVFLDPETTLREAYKLRRKIVKRVAGLSDTFYHVDVRFYPQPAYEMESKGRTLSYAGGRARRKR